MSVETAATAAKNGLSRRLPAEPLPCPTLDASAAPGASAWLPDCNPERSWCDCVIEQASAIIESHAPDAEWKRRHVDLVLDGRIHRSPAIALSYVAMLARHNLTFICRSGTKVFAGPYAGATRQ